MEKVIVVGAYIEKDGKILMVQEKGQAMGLWSIPMGHIEEGEPIKNGTRREVKEETGYDVVLGEEIYNATVPGPEYKGGEKDNNKMVGIHVFRGEIVGGSLSFDKESLLDAGWVEKKKVSELPLRGDWLKPLFSET